MIYKQSGKYEVHHTPSPWRILTVSLGLCVCVLSGNVWSEDSSGPIVNYAARFHPLVHENGMVVAAEPLAAQIGVDILRQGGNAVDAAVATAFALAVTYPSAGNLAGGGFMLLDIEGESRFIDYREMAPAAAHRDMFLDASGAIDRKKFMFSRLSAGVPGTVAGLLFVLDKYGSLPLRTVITPAIRLAEKGFEVNFALAAGLQRRRGFGPLGSAENPLFVRADGSALLPGDTLKQKELGWTLKQIRRYGHDGFYAGKVAALIVKDMQNNSGLISLEDLANYRVVERQPVRGSFQGYEIVSAPPPSSGGVHIVQMLNMLEPLDLQAMGHNSATYIHWVSEAMKRAYADRSQYLGDPDFFEVPIKQLIDKDYAAKLRADIKAERAGQAKNIRPGAQLAVQESEETTHFSVVDHNGNVVSNTYTLNFSYGSGIMVPGTGMLLNNEMADFSAKPGAPNPFGLVGGEANEVAAKKRPLSSMSPTIVYKNDRPWLVTGSPGGSVIITSVLHTLLNTISFDMNLATATALPRFHHQWLPDVLRVEQGVSTDTQRLLLDMGHVVESSKRTLGRTQSILIGPPIRSSARHSLYGMTDTRRPQGAVAGY